MSVKGDAGKWAEREAKLWLEAASSADAAMSFHRFPDARAARGALAAQPSDFMVVRSGELTFVEVKETAEVRRLPRAKVSQYGSLLKFHFAGAKVAVLVYRSAHQDWVLFENEALFDHEESPTSFKFLASQEKYPSAADALADLFN